MTFLQVYAIGACLILALMSALWLVSLRLRNSSIVDIFWGPGFVLANWLYFALTPDGFPARKWLIGGLVTVWGLRLGGWGRRSRYHRRAAELTGVLQLVPPLAWAVVGERGAAGQQQREQRRGDRAPPASRARHRAKARRRQVSGG